jgi:hypothetical protein
MEALNQEISRHTLVKWFGGNVTKGMIMNGWLQLVTGQPETIARIAQEIKFLKLIHLRLQVQN